MKTWGYTLCICRISIYGVLPHVIQFLPTFPWRKQAVSILAFWLENHFYQVVHNSLNCFECCGTTHLAGLRCEDNLNWPVTMSKPCCYMTGNMPLSSTDFKEAFLAISSRRMLPPLVLEPSYPPLASLVEKETLITVAYNTCNRPRSSIRKE